MLAVFWQLKRRGKYAADVFISLVLYCFVFFNVFLLFSHSLSFLSAFCACPVGGVLRGDDHGAGRICDADRLPAEQLQGAAAAVHGSGVRLVHRSGGHPRAQYVEKAHTPHLTAAQVTFHPIISHPWESECLSQLKICISVGEMCCCPRGMASDWHCWYMRLAMQACTDFLGEEGSRYQHLITPNGTFPFI